MKHPYFWISCSVAAFAGAALAGFIRLLDWLAFHK